MCVCVCVCGACVYVYVCVCVCACTDPIIMFIPDVECGFLWVHNVMCELFEGMYLNITVNIMYFVACYAVPFDL